MTPAPLYEVDALTVIEFTEALARLQAQLGQEVRLLVNFHGTFGGCVIQGRLSRVETIPPDDSAVNILIDEHQGVTLDPIDTEAVLTVSADGKESLGFDLPSGVAITLEQP